MARKIHILKRATLAGKNLFSGFKTLIPKFTVEQVMQAASPHSQLKLPMNFRALSCNDCLQENSPLLNLHESMNARHFGTQNMAFKESTQYLLKSQLPFLCAII